MYGADRGLVKMWRKTNALRFENVMLKTKTVSARALPEGVEVTFALPHEGDTTPAPWVYDLVLQAIGCMCNGMNSCAEVNAKAFNAHTILSFAYSDPEVA